jgi:hypothetical protein
MASSESVLGKLRYVAANHVPEASPHSLHLPVMTDFGDERLLPIHTLRPIPTSTPPGLCDNKSQLQSRGFTAIHRSMALNSPPFTSKSFANPQLLKQHLIPDTEDLLKQLTGCKSVVTEAILLRAALWTETDALASHGSLLTNLSDLETGFPQFIGFNPEIGGASPASKIHLDYSPKGTRSHIRNFHPNTAQAASEIIRHEDALLADGKNLEDNYKTSGGPRWALYSIWRPLKVVKRDPLAMADYRTIRDDDYVRVDVKYPKLGREKYETHLAECFLARHSEGHKWHWIDDQTPEEVLVLRFFDSDEEGKGSISAGGVLHSSVELPGTENEEPRESLEIRCMCIW